MKIFEYTFHKCDKYWLCRSPIGENWFICRQTDPLIIVEFDHNTQTGKIAGIGNTIIGSSES